MITRRHMLTIAAAAGGASLLGLSSHAKAHVTKWRGVALGGEASMHVIHPDPIIAENMIKSAVNELRRLEKIFSLYDPASSLSKLNEESRLEMPPIELVMLLNSARQISEASNGLFDVTVQPLWDHYQSSSLAYPDPIIGQKHMIIDRQAIILNQGQKITLNGIAQGAITDHLMEMFKNNGFSNLLLSTGEISAFGKNENNHFWSVALGHHGGTVLELNNAAVATSEAIPLKEGSSNSHFFNPLNGRNESYFNRVSVVAANATIADGLSTALMLSEEKNWPDIIDQFSSMPLSVHFERKDKSLGEI